MSIFVSQTLLTLQLDTGIDITTSTVQKILYQKPTGVKGEFTATVADTTKVSYNVQANDLDQAGTWIMQSFVTLGGVDGYGDKVYITVEPNLT